jgi:hypothetical protein
MSVLPKWAGRCLESVSRQIGCCDCWTDEEPTVVVCGGRNWNLSVGNGIIGSFHVKFPPEDAATSDNPVRREVEFYTLRQGRASGVANRFLPRLIACDPDWPFLALEALGGATPLWEQIRASRLKSGGLLECVGGALGIFHSDLVESAPQWATQPAASPWVMNAHRPGIQAFATLSPATRQLLTILQSSVGFPDHLDDLRPRWKPQTLIHGDLRSDNILVFPPNPGSEYVVDQIRFIDWETVCFGDPAWDVAAVLQDMAFFWICSMCEGTRGWLSKKGCEGFGGATVTREA